MRDGLAVLDLVRHQNTTIIIIVIVVTNTMPQSEGGRSKQNKISPKRETRIHKRKPHTYLEYNVVGVPNHLIGRQGVVFGIHHVDLCHRLRTTAALACLELVVQLRIAEREEPRARERNYERPCPHLGQTASHGQQCCALLLDNLKKTQRRRHTQTHTQPGG